MYSKILVANRGINAMKIINTCKELGIKTVAIYSEADKNSLHIRYADEAYCIGPKEIENSYLDIYRIISVASLCKAEAIHPGIGFLSESSMMAKICAESNIKFIGPNPQALELTENKMKIKKFVKELGVPVIPGIDEELLSYEEAFKRAENCEYAFMIKSVYGGGGFGIKRVRNKNELLSKFREAQFEAELTIGRKELYIEKALDNIQHIEVQIVGDKYGNVISLGNRDCTLQVNNQKIVEQTPPNNITIETAKIIKRYALKIMRALNYDSIGTVEFLVDENNKVYFLEINPRLQVEHGITEMVTGINLVEEQILISQGKKIEYEGQGIVTSGVALECRINFENNKNSSKVQVEEVILPSSSLGLIVESSIYAGYKFNPYNDPLLMKIITYSKSRKKAIEKMKCALDNLVIKGINTNVEYQRKVINCLR